MFFELKKRDVAYEDYVGWHGELRFAETIVEHERDALEAFSRLQLVPGLVSAELESFENGGARVKVELHDGFRLRVDSSTREEQIEAIVVTTRAVCKHLRCVGPPNGWHHVPHR